MLYISVQKRCENCWCQKWKSSRIMSHVNANKTGSQLIKVTELIFSKRYKQMYLWRNHVHTIFFFYVFYSMVMCTSIMKDIRLEPSRIDFVCLFYCRCWRDFYQFRSKETVKSQARTKFCRLHLKKGPFVIAAFYSSEAQSRSSSMSSSFFFRQKMPVAGPR